MSDWVVKVRADRLEVGQRFVFSEEMGGQGEVLTSDGTQVALGYAYLMTVELDWEIEVMDNQMIEVRGEEES